MSAAAAAGPRDCAQRRRRTESTGPGQGNAPTPGVTPAGHWRSYRREQLPGKSPSCRS